MPETNRKWRVENPEKVKLSPSKDPKIQAGYRKKYRATAQYRDARDKYRASEKYTETRRNLWYKNKYHITFEEFQAQIEKQNGLCPIGCHPFGPLGQRSSSPCLDHDHETGVNREIICRGHNSGLGQFNDSIEELEFALQYLKKHKQV